jgi:hypothetical protein
VARDGLVPAKVEVRARPTGPEIKRPGLRARRPDPAQAGAPPCRDRGGGRGRFPASTSSGPKLLNARVGVCTGTGRTELEEYYGSSCRCRGELAIRRVIGVMLSRTTSQTVTGSKSARSESA